MTTPWWSTTWNTTAPGSGPAPCSPVWSAAHADGHDHAPAACAAGAVALLVEKPLDLGVPEIQVPEVRTALGHCAAKVHDDPSSAMQVVGVTGTNGKTTTVALIAAVTAAAGRPTGVIGTLTGARTTPESTELQRQLAAFRDQGHTTVVMEVSSHALTQHRVTGTRFEVAVFTNLSPEHLDFHGTMEDYFRAKARLFEPDLSERAVVALDDRYGRLLLDASTIPTEGFALADAEPVISVDPVVFTWHGALVTTALSGRFNVANAVAAATTASALGVADEVIRDGLGASAVVPGRFEAISVGQPFRVVVDFAHTPDGLAKLLETAREIAEGGRVLVAFGAGGDRDAAKRPLMGATVRDRADVIMITNDNPRHEDPNVIIDQISQGIGSRAHVHVLPDRRAAIAALLDEAREGDVVVIAGKGHEATQTIGEATVAFDDRAVARALLAERGWAS